MCPIEEAQLICVDFMRISAWNYELCALVVIYLLQIA